MRENSLQQRMERRAYIRRKLKQQRNEEVNQRLAKTELLQQSKLKVSARRSSVQEANILKVKALKTEAMNTEVKMIESCY